jgi:hypothetical protein
MPVYTRNGGTDSTLPRPKGLLTSGEQAIPLLVPAGLSSRENLSECTGVLQVTLATATDADSHGMQSMRRLQVSIVKVVNEQRTLGYPNKVCSITL